MDNQANTSAWLLLSAGQGPKECGWVVAQLSKRLLKEAYKTKLSAEIVESLAFDKHLRKQDTIDIDAFLSILIRLEGKGIEDFIRQWEGSIKWQGESPYRAKHKRINWFVGISRLSVAKEQAKSIIELEKEIDIETMRAKGPGGQHVNKTNSAVRITHRPSGLRVRIESDRSQHRNKQLALERLQLLLNEKQNEKSRSLEHARWQQHYQVQRGKPIRLFYGNDFTE